MVSANPVLVRGIVVRLKWRAASPHRNRDSMHMPFS